MTICFKNEGILSLIDLTTMGDSIKRSDSSKIGKFDSGLKYAISILYRHGVEIEIRTGETIYTFSSENVEDKITNKTKKLININALCGDKNEKIITAFSPEMGHEWKLWMAVRELYSNCIDENGSVSFIDSIPERTEILGKTEIYISSDSMSSMIESWDKYFIPVDKEPIYQNDSIKIYENPDKYLKLYKNRILVFFDKQVTSKFCYDYNHASIDEMRMLNDRPSFKDAIESCVCYSSDHDFINMWITDNNESNWEASFYYKWICSEWVVIISNVFKETGNLDIYKELYNAVKEDSLSEIGVKSIRQSNPHYESHIDVTPITDEQSKEMPFDEHVKSICSEFNFNVSYPIVRSEATGATCIRDSYKKVIYVTDQFCGETFWEMVKAVTLLDGGDNDQNYIYKEFAKQLNNH